MAAAAIFFLLLGCHTSFVECGEPSSRFIQKDREIENEWLMKVFDAWNFPAVSLHWRPLCIKRRTRQIAQKLLVDGCWGKKRNQPLCKKT
jgi:hypothetical protein